MDLKKILDTKTGIIYTPTNRTKRLPFWVFKEMIALNLSGFDTGVNGWWDEDVTKDVKYLMLRLEVLKG